MVVADAASFHWHGEAGLMDGLEDFIHSPCSLARPLRGTAG